MKRTWPTLKPVSFWLGFESPVWRHPARFGIRRTGNHPLYRHLFPDPVLGRLTLMTQGYHGGRRRQHRLWQPVREKTAEWDKEYRRLHKRPGSEPILSYVDGRDFLLIRHRRPGRFHMTHRLRGTSR
ncbi:MAG: hypothetical protein JRH05_14500, partial [Deltaproteobacteria bacterium]|nr:hypothetical protein [Deltaproteobacteria bacterium]